MTKTKSTEQSKVQRRAAARHVRQIRALLTPKEAGQLRKARRRTPGATSRVGIKSWVMKTELVNKAKMVEQGLITAPPAA